MNRYHHRVFQGLAVLGSFTMLVTACSSSKGAQSDTTSAPTTEKQQTITVGAWGGAYDGWTQEAFAKPFTEKSGAKFQYDDAASQMVSRVVAQHDAGQVTWDVLDSAFGLDAWTLWKKGLLAPVPEDLAKKWKEALGEETVTPFGYALGNLGDVIVCNRSVVAKCPTTPAEFFDVAGFPGERAMYGPGSLIGVMLAEEARGVSPNKLFPVDLDSAFNTLKELKPHIALWYDAPDQLDQAIRSKEVSIAIAFNGRVANLIKEGIDLNVSWQGAIYEPVYMTVIKDGPSTQAAWDYLDFIAMSTSAQAKYVELTGYGVPNRKAFESVSTDIAKYNPDYPDNKKVMALEDLDWYLANQAEVDQRWRDLVGG
ncbi:MAG: extracellular solute-binding protein [Actinobacteria bacterium]|nr:extracellular solute-binding protein [Actinomycetota bacterium]